jgi:hypothetical protein
MKMQLVWLATLSLLAAPAVRAQAGEHRGLLDLLPADTLAFAGTDDAQACAAAWADTATGRLHATPEFAAYAKAYKSGLAGALQDTLPGLGLDVETLETWLKGPCGLAVLHMGMPAAGEDDPAFTFALVCGVTGHDEEVKDLLQKVADAAPEKGLLATQTNDGETDIITLRAEPDEDTEGEIASIGVTRMTVHAGTLLLTHEMAPSGKDWLARLMDGVDGKGGDTLAGRADLKATPAGAGGPDLRAWIDLAGLQRELGKFATALAGEDEMAKAEIEEVLGAIDRLGIDELRSLSWRFTLSHDSTRSVVRLDWPAGSPLRDALSRFVTGSARASLLALAPEKPLFASGMDGSWEDAFDDIVRCVMAGGQLEASAVSAGLAEMREGLGFDLRDDLLARLDGRIAFVMADVPEGEGLALPMPGMEALLGKRNMLLALGLADSAGVRTLLDTVLRGSGLHTGRKCTELQGFEVCNVPFFPGVAINYAILPDVLLISGSSTLVQDALRRSATPDLPDLAARKDVAAGFAALPPQPGAALYADGIEWMMLSAQQQAAPEDPNFSVDFGGGLIGHMLQASQAAARAFPAVDRAFFEKFYKTPTLGGTWVNDQAFVPEMLGP